MLAILCNLSYASKFADFNNSYANLRPDRYINDYSNNMLISRSPSIENSSPEFSINNITPTDLEQSIEDETLLHPIDNLRGKLLPKNNTFPQFKPRIQFKNRMVRSASWSM